MNIEIFNGVMKECKHRKRSFIKIVITESLIWNFFVISIPLNAHDTYIYKIHIIKTFIIKYHYNKVDNFIKKEYL